MESGEGGSPKFSTLLASRCFFVGFLCLKGCRGIEDGWPFLRGLMCCLRTGKQRGVVEHRVITVGGIRCCPVLQPSGCPAASGQRAKPRVSRPEGRVSWPRPEGTWCHAVASKGRVGNAELGRWPGGLQTSGRGSRSRGTHRALCPRTCWGLLKGCAACPARLAGPGRGSAGGGGGQLSAALHAWASCTARGPWRLTRVSLATAELAPCLRLKRKGTGVPKGQDLLQQEQ